MSVINQMLKDLEQRQQGELPAAPVLSASLPARSKAVVWISCLAVFSCLLLAGAAYFLSTQWKLVPKTEVAQTTAISAAAEMTPPAQRPASHARSVAPQTPAPQAAATPISNKAKPASEPVAKPAATMSLPTDRPVTVANETDSTREVIAYPQRVQQDAQQPARNSLPLEQPNPPATGQQLTKARAKPSQQTLTQPPPALKITPVQLSASELAEVKHRKAKQAFSRQQVEQGIKLLAQVVKLDPNRDNARIELASHYYSGRRLGDAVKVLEQGVVEQPDNTQFRRMLARIFMEREQLQQAFSYTRMLPTGPRLDVEYLSIRAGLAQRLERFDDAHDSYRALAEYQPDQAKWWLGLAMASDRLEQTNVAYEAYRRAISEAGLSDASRRYAEQRIRQLEMR